MSVDEFLAMCSGVRRAGVNGFMARCPAHADKNPSLSVREGERGLLVKCWSGCMLENICISLGITVRDLFYDAIDADQPKQPLPQRHSSDQPFDWRSVTNELFFHADGFWLRGDKVLNAARGLDVTNWTEEELNQAMEAVSEAYANIALATRLEDLAFDLRCEELTKEQKP